MATKKKKIATEAAEAPEEGVDGRWRSMMESVTTEAEYQEPVVPVEPVDPLEREYPGLHQDIPKILKAILRELVIARCGK